MRDHSSDGIELAVDVGGTFTDIVLLDEDGSIARNKVLSTVPSFELGVLTGLRSVLEAHGAAPKTVLTIYHGTTVATNAVLEGRGSVPALVGTRGFRDVLEMGTGRRPQKTDLLWTKPPPLVPRRLRFVIDQRITAKGELDPPFRSESVDELAARLIASGVTSVAVSLVNSYVRPDEERRLVHELRQRCPALMFSASVDLSLEPPEYDRASTAVVNAYVAPVMRSYLDQLQVALREEGIYAPLYVMQSSGGLLGVAEAREFPVQIIESGPAAGVVAVTDLSRRLGIGNLIAFDIGGTTAKATLIENGVAYEASAYEVGAGMNAHLGSNSGAGYLVKVPCFDIAEVGSGGGSIFWVDDQGVPHLGPRSAGASPGPACYGLGGHEPTLTDAAVVLGLFNPHSIAGGAQGINRPLAEAAISKVAGPLGLELHDAAYGAVRIAISNMTPLVRAVTTQRGRDPRDYALVAFGGSGPAYATDLARALEISTVIVPMAPGLFNALGLLISDHHHDIVRHNLGLAVSATELRVAFREMEAEMSTMLQGSGYPSNEVTFQYSLDMRYKGQKGTIRISLVTGGLSGPDEDSVLRQLDEEHFRAYGHHKSQASAEVVNLRLRAIRRRPRRFEFGILGKTATGPPDPSVARVRKVYFGPEVGWIVTPILDRLDIGDTLRPGPMIVEEMDSTTVVPPGARVKVDRFGNIMIRADESTN